MEISGVPLDAGDTPVFQGGRISCDRKSHGEGVDSFNTKATLTAHDCAFEIRSLPALHHAGFDPSRLPFSIRILLENVLRHEDGTTVTADDIAAVASWGSLSASAREIPFRPARVLMQDFTGVPAVVDLAAMRDAMAAAGGDPDLVNPRIPVELVIDHSMQVDAFGSQEALRINRQHDYARNRERYALLRWAQQAFENLQVVPPYTGICHQVNLEYLARVVFTSDETASASSGEAPLAYPDTLVGTDSHTPMVNGLGVLGWGVGGIEAEAAILGQPISFVLPEVMGIRVDGELRSGATATDLVLTVTELLRARGVVGKFVEFFGPGITAITVPNRATIGNMSPEYGATCTMFPVDDETLRYLRFTGRPSWRVELVERYMKEQGLFYSRGGPEADYSSIVDLDLSTVEPSIAGPRRPQDRIALSAAKESFTRSLTELLPKPSTARSLKRAALGSPGAGTAEGVWGEGSHGEARRAASSEVAVSSRNVEHGSVVIASITSCTNTSNPDVMIAAGLLAKKAVERGLTTKPWVKTSLAPGSKVVTEYLQRASLLPALESLGFHVVGYGCATCIGNSGPLAAEVSDRIAEEGLVVCSVLSGNRNFEGRIHSEVRANYLMSPPLVVAYALAGKMNWDPHHDPIGFSSDDSPVYLRDIWPSSHEIQNALEAAIDSDMFRKVYSSVFHGDEEWQALPVPGGALFAWDEHSTYVRYPPFFARVDRDDGARDLLNGARVLALLGDSVTTDHISPAGSICAESAAGEYLRDHGVQPQDFNSYGARRGNHEVMMRGTFASTRLRNMLAGSVEGGVTVHLPSNRVESIFEASVAYSAAGTPLLIVAGKEYGTGSSRDWAAKGPLLLGVRAVLAESYERIHRSNLIGMGILPLQFMPGVSAKSLGLDGTELFDLSGLETLHPRAQSWTNAVRVHARRASGEILEVPVLVRIDTPQEARYFTHGGILPFVLQHLLAGESLSDVRPYSADAVGTVRESVGDRSERAIDESSIESFPASDPPAF